MKEGSGFGLPASFMLKARTVNGHSCTRQQLHPLQDTHTQHTLCTCCTRARSCTERAVESHWGAAKLQCLETERGEALEVGISALVYRLNSSWGVSEGPKTIVDTIQNESGSGVFVFLSHQSNLNPWLRCLDILNPCWESSYPIS